MSQSASTTEAPRSRFLESAVGSWFAAVAEGLSVVRAPAAMSIVTVLALWLPQQAWELYRLLMQKVPETTPIAQHFHWLTAMTALFVLSLMLWLITRDLIYTAARHGGLDGPPAAQTILDWSPRIFATAPFVGAALGLWQSLPPTLVANLPEEVLTDPALSEILKRQEINQSNIWLAIGLAAVLAVVMLLAIALVERGLPPVTPAKSLPQTRWQRYGFFARWVIFPLAGAAVIVAFIWDPIRLPRIVGVIPVFALWVAVLTVGLAFATRIYDVYRIPVIWIAIIAVVAFQFMGLSDNHWFRQMREPPTRPDVRQAFLDWISSRADTKAYRDAGKAYPIYIVAAEGGGMYAAYHSAKMLSRMSDLCEAFPQHVFAVSSVSGGSLGAAVFASLTQKQVQKSEPKPCKPTVEKAPGGYEARAERILEHDFLSPLIYAALFPDFLQRFLPVPIQRFDRAIALEQSFEAAWAAENPTDKSNPFAGSFLDLCGPGSATCSKEQMVAPALLLNTTNVETGSQMVLSPLDLGYLESSPTGSIADIYRTSPELRHIPLSTAVGLSARFPWVLPVGWFQFTQKPASNWNKNIGAQSRRMSFVDGGYSEGSGIVTADNLAQYLHRVLQEDEVKQSLQGLSVAIKIILITGTYAPVNQFFNTVQRSVALGELESPIATLLQAWRARNASFPSEFAGENRRGPIPALSARFNNDFITIALGWQLTRLSRDYLDLFIGDPNGCDRARRAAPSPADVDPLVEPLLSINDTDCVIKGVMDDLQAALPVGTR